MISKVSLVFMACNQRQVLLLQPFCNDQHIRYDAAWLAPNEQTAGKRADMPCDAGMCAQLTGSAAADEWTGIHACPCSMSNSVSSRR